MSLGQSVPSPTMTTSEQVADLDARQAGTLIGFTVAGALFAGRLEERERDAR